ncbi:MAG: cation transporter [Reichenbachiella sp.]
MQKTTFKITKMDCPSEEQMIRMKLEGIESIKQMDFDIPNRKLSIVHSGNKNEFEGKIHDLQFDATFLGTEQNVTFNTDHEKDNQQRKILWWVLVINFSFFIIEMTYGWISMSMGLVADSLDMLADSIVYGLSLLAVGAAVTRKKFVAKMSGYFQLLLAVVGLIEVVRRFVGDESIPLFQTMIVVSCLALIANGFSLFLIQKVKSKDAHMQASAIFTSNDIIINLGVITAGALVYFTKSVYPDLIVGSIIFIIVIRGAFRILSLSK